MTEQQAIDKFLAWWRQQLGYHEGEDNYNKYAENPDLIKLYGWKPQKQPWCDTIYDTGMIECFGLQAASEMTYQPIGKGSALCKASAQYYRNNGAWYGTPKAGDQFFLYVGGSIEHTGVVESVSGETLTTMEGNTTDMVARRYYAVNSPKIAGYGRPKWSVVAKNATVEPQPDVVISETERPTEDSSATVSGLPTLRKGDKGEVVRAAQFLLNGRKCSVGIWGADGDFGNGTESAVLAFQRRNNLDADGIIGPRTWAALLGVSG